MTNEKNANVESEITIKLVFESEGITDAINKSTIPENREAPKGIVASSKVDGKNLQIKITSEKSLKDLLTTVEDYLEKIDLSYKTIHKLKR